MARYNRVLVAVAVTFTAFANNIIENENGTYRMFSSNPFSCRQDTFYASKDYNDRSHKLIIITTQYAVSVHVWAAQMRKEIQNIDYEADKI